MSSISKIYNEFLASGNLDSKEFLAAQAANVSTALELGGKLGLRNPQLTSSPVRLLGVEFQIYSPKPGVETALFLETDQGVKLLDEPISFLESCEEVDFASEYWESEVPILEKAVLDWATARIRFYESELQAGFKEDCERLTIFFQESTHELRSKRRESFHHTYYFEKSSRFQEELTQLLKELHEQEELLVQRFRLRYSLRKFLTGVLLP